MIKIGLIVTWSVVSDTRYELQVRGPQTGCRAVTQLPQEVMIVLQFPYRENKYSLTYTHTHNSTYALKWSYKLPPVYAHSSTLKCFNTKSFIMVYRQAKVLYLKQFRVIDYIHTHKNKYNGINTYIQSLSLTLVGILT